ncbi:MAG: hypothetical protein HYS21_05570 [Deltaproteobacteria bacterium]|nr:hypothetical protein [Deltaproteobacteria bacterium]
MKTPELKNLYIHFAFFSIAVIVRVILCSYLGLIELPDSETYELFALQVYNGLPITLPTRPLGYPLFISYIYNIFDSTDRTYVIYAQNFLGAFTYFIYYLIFRQFFKNRLTAAAAALCINLAGTFLIFERAILSDFLSHFFILIGAYLILKFFSSGKVYLMAPLAIATFLALIIRPTANIFLVLVFGFLSLQFLYRLIKKQDGALNTAKAAALYIAVFFALNAGFQHYSEWKYGFKGEPVGVFGVNMLIKTAEYMDMDSDLQPELKREFKQYRAELLQDYGQAWYANFLGGYKLIVNIRCEIPEDTKKQYLEVAASADSFYGSHAVGSDYFSTHDLLRELQCDINTADRIVLAIAKEAILSNPLDYVSSSISNLGGYIKVKAWEYRLYSKQADRVGAYTLGSLIRGYGKIETFMAKPAVAGLLTFLLAFGALSYFVQEKNKEELFKIFFLASFLITNYLMLAFIVPHPVQRYKIPTLWIQFFLFIYFVPYSIRLVSKITGRKNSKS